MEKDKRMERTEGIGEKTFRTMQMLDEIRRVSGLYLDKVLRLDMDKVGDLGVKSYDYLVNKIEGIELTKFKPAYLSYITTKTYFSLIFKGRGIFVAEYVLLNAKKFAQLKKDIKESIVTSDVMIYYNELDLEEIITIAQDWVKYTGNLIEENYTEESHRTEVLAYLIISMNFAVIETSFENMKKQAEEKGVNFDVLATEEMIGMQCELEKIKHRLEEKLVEEERKEKEKLELEK